MVGFVGLRHRECHCAQRFGGRDVIQKDGFDLSSEARHRRT